MGIEVKRSEDWFINRCEIDKFIEFDERSFKKISANKYLTVSSKNIGDIKNIIGRLLSSGCPINGKIIAIDIVDGFYLNSNQCKELEEVKTQLENVGAEFKIKDGNYWSLEDVSVVASKLDNVIDKINNATVEENEIKRTLNELEKFLWAYSFVANRKYRENEHDKDSSRHITSIFTDEDCVCVGFSTILKELCDKLGIECYKNSCNVYKKSLNDSFGHANNIVIINGKAYYCDACWDCVSSSRPKRTFSNCLIPFEDIKETPNSLLSETTAPFCDLVEDLQDIKSKFNYINNKENFGEEDYYNLINHENKIYKYMNIIPKFEYPKMEYFLKRKYKEEILFYYSQAIKQIESKQPKNLLTINNFETALINIYKANGNTTKQALEKAKLDIDATIQESGQIFSENAQNCFAKEYYKTLEV